ncbi:hypothetical protein ACFSHQ_19165 [Gemmobacter lanyuensis]
MRLYRTIMRALMPVLLGQALLQRLRGRLEAGALAERLGARGRARWICGFMAPRTES